MNFSIKKELENIKKELKKDGFIIEGVVGSFSRGDFDERSDIDILYSIDYKKFVGKNSGFLAFKKLEDIKKLIENRLKRKVDLINKNSLNKISKKYILKDLIEVR